MSTPRSSAGSASFMHPKSEEIPIQTDELPIEQSVEQPKQREKKERIPMQYPVEDPPGFIQGRRIPTMGFPRFWFELRRSLDKMALPPKKLSKKELEHIERQEAEQRRTELIARQVAARAQAKDHMRRCSDEVPSFTVAFIGVKGAAGTTTTMVNVTTVLADITRTTVYAGDFNPASGSAGTKLGKDYNETISLREFGEMVEEIERNAAPGQALSLTKQQVNAKMRPTEYGVRTLIADDYTLETTEQFGTRTKKILAVLQENCDYLSLDTPNDITTPAAKAVLDAADVLVFTANVAVKDSLRMLYTSMEKVRQLGIKDPKLKVKVRDSIVVITNTPEGADLESYKKYLNRTDLEHNVSQRIGPDEFNGHFMEVPHDPYIARDGKVKPEEYAWETNQAYINIAIAVFERANHAAELEKFNRQ